MKRDFQESGGKISKSNFLETDSNIFSMSYLENNGTLVRKNIIELNRYTGFIKHEFRTNIETIYRTGTCKDKDCFRNFKFSQLNYFEFIKRLVLPLKNLKVPFPKCLKLSRSNDFYY